MSEHLPSDDELLLRYIDGTLSPEEKAGLEARFQSDPVLEKRLEQLRVSVAAVRYYGAAARVKSIHREMMQELGPKRGKLAAIRRMLRYSVAAAASIVLVVVAINLLQSSKPSAAELYDEAFVDYTVSATRGGEGLSPVEERYRRNNTAAVIEQRALAASTKDSLLVGISFLKNNAPADAVNWLRELKGGYEKDASFYLVLAYLKNKEYKQALNLARRIRADQSHPYRNQFTVNFIEGLESLAK